MNRHSRDFDVVEFHADNVVALDDVFETVTSTFADTLSCYLANLICARIENEVEHCVSRRLHLGLDHREIAVQGEKATRGRIGRRRCRWQLTKRHGVQGERKSDQQEEALSTCHECNLREAILGDYGFLRNTSIDAALRNRSTNARSAVRVSAVCR